MDKNNIESMEIGFSLLTSLIKSTRETRKPIIGAFDKWLINNNGSLSDSELNTLRYLRNKVLVYMK